MISSKMMNISSQLKRRRLELGLSLTELARRVGTSPATLSRYEGGWQRFEVATLRRIATALGCRLNVRFEPLGSCRSPKRAHIVKRLSRLFWDHKLVRDDIERYPQWVVERVIEYGDIDDIHALIQMLGRDAFLEQVAASRFASTMTEQFWRQMLELEGVPCTKRSFPREAWSSSEGSK